MPSCYFIKQYFKLTYKWLVLIWWFGKFSKQSIKRIAMNQLADEHIFSITSTIKYRVGFIGLNARCLLKTYPRTINICKCWSPDGKQHRQGKGKYSGKYDILHQTFFRRVVLNSTRFGRYNHRLWAFNFTHIHQVTK